MRRFVSGRICPHCDGTDTECIYDHSPATAWRIKGLLVTGVIACDAASIVLLTEHVPYGGPILVALSCLSLLFILAASRRTK